MSESSDRAAAVTNTPRLPLLTGWSIAIPVTTTVVMVVVTLAVTISVETESFYYPLGVFMFAIAWSGLALAYPFLAVVVFVVPFSERLRKRWIVYTRPRVAIRRYIWRAAASNATIAFLAFFLYVLAVFVFTFYLQPAWGAEYSEYAPGDIPDDVAAARMTQLLGIHPVLFGISYAAWSGANAAAWATWGLVALLLVRSRIVAFVLPFVVFLTLSVVMGLLGGVPAQNTPWLLWMLFSVTQVPMVPSMIALALLVGLSVVVLALVARLSDRLESVM